MKALSPSSKFLRNLPVGMGGWNTSSQPSRVEVWAHHLGFAGMGGSWATVSSVIFGVEWFSSQKFAVLLGYPLFCLDFFSQREQALVRAFCWHFQVISCFRSKPTYINQKGNPGNLPMGSFLWVAVFLTYLHPSLHLFYVYLCVVFSCVLILFVLKKKIFPDITSVRQTFIRESIKNWGLR